MVCPWYPWWPGFESQWGCYVFTDSTDMPGWVKEVTKTSICEISLKNTPIKLLPHFQWAMSWQWLFLQLLAKFFFFHNQYIFMPLKAKPCFLIKSIIRGITTIIKCMYMYIIYRGLRWISCSLCFFCIIHTNHSQSSSLMLIAMTLQYSIYDVILIVIWEL